jgi:hypothetical protein
MNDPLTISELLLINILLSTMTEVEIRQRLISKGLNPKDVERLTKLFESAQVKLLTA